MNKLANSIVEMFFFSPSLMASTQKSNKSMLAMLLESVQIVMSFKLDWIIVSCITNCNNIVCYNQLQALSLTSEPLMAGRDIRREAKI